MMLLKRPIYIFISLFCFVTIQSQTYNFKNYNTDEGLAQSQVLCVFQDSKGFMWFGTNSGGASKFDGHNFQSITKNEGLIDNVIYSITENKKHQLFFGTSKGLSVYDNFEFKNYGEKDGLKNPWIFRLFEDDDKVWIGTQSGVSIYKDGKILPFSQDSTLNNSLVWSIFKDRQQNYWFGTFQNGLVFYDSKTKKFKHITDKNGLTNNYIFCITQENNGNMLVGTQTGLNRVNKNFEVSETKEIKSNNNIAFCSVLKDNDDYYFGTYSEGLLKVNFKDSSLKAFHLKNGLSNFSIFSIYKDREGVIWAGSAGKGVYKYQNDKFIYYSKLNGLPDNYVNTVKEDNVGNLWVSIATQGLVKIKDKQITQYKADFKNPRTLPDNGINAILPLKNEEVLFGTEAGLTLFNGQYFKLIENENFKNKYIQTLFKDSKNKIWIGTNTGVFSYFNHQIQEEKVINQFNPEGKEFLIFFINEDKSCKLYFGLENGMIQLDGDKAKIIDDKNNFTKSRVCNSAIDYNNRVWFGSADGLFTLKNNQFKKVKLPNGNSFGFITFLQVDKNKHLLVGTNQEVYIIDLEPFEKGLLQFKQLNKEDGLLSKESNFNATTLDKEGRVYIGTANGLEVYDPNKDVSNKNEPLTHIIKVELFFGHENILDYSNGVDSTTMLPRKLILPYNKNNLTFHFIGVSLVTPEKVMYQYKMQGLDKDWTPASKNVEAVYPALPPGKYTFMVKAMNNDGLWNKEPITYSFVVLPPWYKTWWFRIFVLLAVLISAWVFIKSREKKLVREKEILEAKVTARTAKIVEQKHIIEEKQQEILDSINYAQRIQRALLASDKILNDNLPEHFVFFRPKDVVSGDFYWASVLADGRFALVTADSTGHGVPGAIMSMLNISCLNDSIEAKRFTNPAEILNNTRSRIINHLANDGSEEGGKDGMDCSLICFDFKSLQMDYAAANNSILVVRDSSDNENISATMFSPDKSKILIELDPDSMPVGKHDRDKTSFKQSNFELKKGDMIFTLTDGFPDQFGGAKGKKFMYKKLKELFISISGQTIADQKNTLAKMFDEWKGDLEQVDDVLVIGIRI